MDEPPAERFKISSTVRVLFARLPNRLKDHVAFQHFFTDDLDSTSHFLCVKFYTLFILHLCCVFRLEGRRRQYVSHRTERSGREFAAAHKRAQRVFIELTNVYSTILMRYNKHSTIFYSVKHAIQIRGRRNQGPYTFGMKNPTSLVVSVPAFQYEADEMLFYEYLNSFLIQITRLAFAEDDNVQEIAAMQVLNMMRSGAFSFKEQRRSNDVKILTSTIESKSMSLLDNTKQLADLLTAPTVPIIMKYANNQRSPFISCRYPGGTSIMKYQRPFKKGHSLPSINEKRYTINATTCPFPRDHPAVGRLVEYRRRHQMKAAQAVRATGITPDLFSDTTSDGQSLALTQNRTAASNYGLAQSMAASVSAAAASWPGGTMDYHNASIDIHWKPFEDTIATTRTKNEHQKKELKRREEKFFEIFDAPMEAWGKVDLITEIENIYQAIANGVPVGDFSMPRDLMLSYDEEGILNIDEKDGSPIIVS